MVVLQLSVQGSPQDLGYSGGNIVQGEKVKVRLCFDGLPKILGCQHLSAMWQINIKYFVNSCYKYCTFISVDLSKLYRLRQTQMAVFLIAEGTSRQTVGDHSF